jgi:phosphoribosyl 1,2-cyclic phosphate phosphodiesterase
MNARLRFHILGCGSSGGVPRIGGHWGECDPANPKNRRRRCSMLVERETDQGVTRVLIDTSPDMRDQLINAGVGALDGVIYTHSHADHVHGVDDLRMVVFNMRERVNVWADQTTCDALLDRFGYVFIQPEGSSYPPILNLNLLNGPVRITGLGGEITFTPFEVEHGRIDALGFRIKDLVYLPDVSAMNKAAWDVVSGANCWVLDALRRDPHPTHSHLEQSLEWIEKSGVPNAVLTNMHIDLDYETVLAETPDHITPAYDGMIIEYTD